MSRKRTVVGMSSGVDSSVTAWLFKQQGYDVVGLFMRNWEDDDGSEYCSTRQDWTDVVSVTDLVGVDVETVNFTAEYKGRVFTDFLRECSAGRIPNPDVLCNAEIEFKAFLDHVMALGADTIAIGRYTRACGVDGRFELLTAFDRTKDRSYFLHRLDQTQLSHALFPLDEMPKTRMREIAAEIGLSNAKKRGSTEICFIGERPFRGFLNRCLPTEPGPIKTPDGGTIGGRIDLAFYTLGRHKDIGIGGSRDDNGNAWYVAREDMAASALYVVQGHDHPQLLMHTVHADGLSWTADQAPVEDTNLGTRTRYRQAGVPYTIARAGDGVLALVLPETQQAIAPGQSAVLCDGEVCLGGSTISAAEPAVIEKVAA